MDAGGELKKSHNERPGKTIFFLVLFFLYLAALFLYLTAFQMAN